MNILFPEAGLFALILAACFALLQVIFGIRPCWLRVQKRLVLLQFFCVLSGMIVLATAFIANDFSVAYVAQHSHSTLPWIYRFCALWGGHEGSMLLWVFILSAWTSLVALFGRQLPAVTLSRVLVVLGLLALGFYAFILVTSNPFLRLLPNVPADGLDLNPLLQDPGLVSHPPILYLGYVGLSVPFAFAIVALWQGWLDRVLARWMRTWTTISWCFLTLGIMLGSWWAYRELGWGGWWFWDPVENASFMPWLMATALLHSLMVTETRDQFKNWTVLLAICAFSLSLTGTFLVRSGVLISVHAFAVDPQRGIVILVFLLLVIAASLALYAWRGRCLAAPLSFRFWSRESFLLVNNILLLVTMLTVLLGTLYPLLMDVLQWGKLSVGAPYFNTVFIPLFAPLLLVMGVGPLMVWQGGNPAALLKPMLIILLLALLLASLVVVVFWRSHYITIGGLFTGFWLVLATGYHRIRRGLNVATMAVTVAHLGMAVTVIGVVLSSAYSQERDLRLRVGETARLAQYVFRLVQLETVTGANYRATRATVNVSHAGKQLALLHPEYRLYQVSQTDLSKTDIAVSWWRDLYVALGSRYRDGSWSMRIYFKPFVRWIWIGGLIMVSGGLFALLIRRTGIR